MTYAIEQVQLLKQHVSGSVLTPADADYETTRRGWNLAVDQHPALIVVAESAADVVAGVNFAREAGLGVGVQSTGHGVHQPADDHVLIVTSRMKDVQTDVAAQTVHAEAGALWEDVIHATAAHGLAPLLGSSPHVGIVGYSLGGGFGWLARRYGLAADSIRSIDVVTADGKLRTASANENPDLFWGLRGGGVNFGVVTALEFTVYPVATVYGGFLVYPGELAREVLGFFRDWVETIPDELTSAMQIMNFPALPQMPDAIRGKTQVMVRAAYAGNAAEGAGYIQKWLDWRQPLANSFHEMPFAEIGTIANDPVNPTAGYGSNEMFDDLSDEALDIIARHATNKASPLVIHELRHAGGAIARVAPDANAIGNRDAKFYFQLGGPLFTPDAKAASAAYMAKIRAELQPYLRGSAYLNFMSGGEAVHRAQDAYLPASYQRLLALKAQYDPANLFRFGYQLTEEMPEKAR